ncbi:MAG: hypothetical protein QMC77_07505 [Methanocellales archaeon]|nr:hypothetical protein [Methanocellales archaeon]
MEEKRRPIINEAVLILVVLLIVSFSLNAVALSDCKRLAEENHHLKLEYEELHHEYAELYKSVHHEYPPGYLGEHPEEHLEEHVEEVPPEH